MKWKELPDLKFLGRISDMNQAQARYLLDRITYYGVLSVDLF